MAAFKEGAGIRPPLRGALALLDFWKVNGDMLDAPKLLEHLILPPLATFSVCISG